MRRQAWVIAALAALTALPLGALGGPASAPTDAHQGDAAAARQRRELRRLMARRVDPAADALWNAVAYVARRDRIEDRRPHTPAQWHRLHDSAAELIAASRTLAAREARFAPFAGVLEAVAAQALSAIEAQDADALFNVGGRIDAACEACHVAYWYPGESRGH